MPENHMDYIRRHLDGAGGSPPQIDHWNGNAISAFAREMEDKMQASRQMGRAGWHDPEQCSIEHLRHMLGAQILSSDIDFVDVANFAMMLHYRSMDHEARQHAAPNPVDLDSVGA